MIDYYWSRVIPLDLGDGFIAKTQSQAIMEKYDLLGKGALHFVNALSVLVDEKSDEMPEEEWKVLQTSLKRFMIDYENGELYRYLLNTYGAGAINYNAWVHFSSDCIWTVSVRTFTDMPTAILEEYGVRHWAKFSGGMGEEGSQHVTQALAKRSDIYGADGGMSAEMVRGILFSEPADRN